jgi:hypothetical protein
MDKDNASKAAKGGGGDNRWAQVGTGGSSGESKYIPPLACGGSIAMGGNSLLAIAISTTKGCSPEGAHNDNCNQNTICVMNISEDTTDTDLQELYQPSRCIKYMHLSNDKKAMQSCGFTFISFLQ